MAITNPENWYLKKHENGEVFGPVPFVRIQDWARSAQVNSQDMVSDDNTVWNKAPMIPELEMDWLVVVDQSLLYGPTTAESLLEFVQLGEITPETSLINCRTNETLPLSETPFYQTSQAEPRHEKAVMNPLLGILRKPSYSIRQNLQQRLRELESALLDKHRKLTTAEETITRLEVRVKELESRLREASGFRTSSK